MMLFGPDQQLLNTPPQKKNYLQEQQTQRRKRREQELQRTEKQARNQVAMVTAAINEERQYEETKEAEYSSVSFAVRYDGQSPVTPGVRNDTVGSNSD